LFPHEEAEKQILFINGKYIHNYHGCNNKKSPQKAAAAVALFFA